MPRTFSRMIRGRARQVRQMVWLQFDQADNTVAGNSTELLTSLNAAALALRPFTIIRTRLIIAVRSDQITTTERVRAVIGHIIVSDQASAAGVASIPSPVANADAPFFVYEPLLHDFIFGSGVGFQSPGQTNVTVDSKAMRKVGNNEDMVSVIESEGTPGLIVTQLGRVLVKLH